MTESEENFIAGWNTGYFCLQFPASVPTSKAWLMGFEQGEQDRMADVFRNKEQKRKVSVDEIQNPEQLRNLQQTTRTP